MKFLLLQIPPGYEFNNDVNIPQKISSYHPPLGLLYLGSILEDEGHKVEVIDFLAEKYPLKTLLNNLSSTDVVGITVFSSAYKESIYGGRYTFAYKESAKVADFIKRIDSDLPILIGGPHCTIQPEKSLTEISSADICLEGDGEEVIKEIVKTIEGTKNLSDLPGVYYRKNNQIKKGKPAKIIENLDTIPFPARHLVDKYDYGKTLKSYFFKPKFTSIITGRGCPYNCSFCTRNALGYRIFRKRSVENVVSEIQEINEKYDSVMIVDDTFFADEKRANQIIDKLIEIGIDIEIYIQGARVDIAKKDTYIKMKKAGVKHLYYGLESGNQDVLNFYNKSTTIEQIRKAITLSSETGFFTVGTFILGAPIETKKHIEKTIRFACSLPLDAVIFTILTYKYGSPLWDQAVKEGKIQESDDYAVVADSKRGLGNLTREELEDFYRKAIFNFYLRPSYLTKQIKKFLMEKDFDAMRSRLTKLTHL
ncbi:MAG: radical SAM protein [Candidatus Thermoplasmatota archaeon]|nr:radical SAM protein [Candidatus Thermoplasmatota archaeon]